MSGNGDQGTMPWQPIARSRSYELVVDQIEEQILAGRLRVGDRLPGERDLASHLQVSRAAVREAIRSLEAQGVVRSAVGSGKDAGTVVSALPSEALTRLLRLHVALANFPIPDVVAARVMLERSSAALAADNAGEGDLAAMRVALDGMDSRDVDRDRFNELDTAFHVAIAEAGRNRLVADMTIAIRDSMRRPILRALEELGEDWKRVADQLRADHHAIFAAIESGDGALAAERVDQHIRSAHIALPFAGDTT
ncbi:FadR/GntR family transcriptional regulator [Amycolatopsis palatopharyngis]|uniref:FadR/GntR family transcriptional regulator n=1 Tax=Amycolatopsis palatopharyngis TaxID=187982 RepID=UPI001FE5625D|nr:FadR/GntR family transcriptional regulator [Amycolatopsis palatopharyngis]